MKKLTTDRRRVLEYFRDNGPVGAIPLTVTTMRFVRKLVADGLLEECGREPGFMGFTKRQISAAGRKALEESHG